MKKLTQEEVAFYRKHPELVQAIGSKAFIYRTVLVLVFLAGIYLAIYYIYVHYLIVIGL